MTEKTGNGLKRFSLIAPIVVAAIALIYFWGNIFPTRLDTSATELKLQAFQREFGEYKISHDKWAETQIDLFRGDIGDLKGEVVQLRQEIKELRADIYLYMKEKK